tara:strand:+ start:5653 stop:6354 length:702 start_codon:yes stop_codon:yes gene_type:complete
MNKQQRKILLTKIIPKFIIITLIFIGIIAFIGIKILGASAEKEANEFWSNPKNKEKIENAIKNNSSEEYSKTQTKKNRNKTESDKSNRKYKVINKLKFPIPKGWGIKTDIHENSIDLFNVIFEKYNGDGLISIMSRNKHEFIRGLEDYSNYQNEKLVRNMKPTGLNLISDGIIVNKFNGIDAVYEYFDGFQKTTNETIRIIAINFYYKDYAYTIYYNNDDDVLDSIYNTELIK